jgi:hypothetical protein
MPDGERLEKLKREILERTEDEQLTFRVEIYRQLMDRVVEIVGQSEHSAPDDTSDPGSLMAVPIRLWLDANLVYRINELLDEDQVVERERATLERAAARVANAIDLWQQSDDYCPLSRNPLFGLIGLYVEDFISHDELMFIAGSDELGARVRLNHVSTLYDLILMMYFTVAGRQRDDSADVNDGSWAERHSRGAAAHRRDVHQGAVLAVCEVMGSFASREPWVNQHLRGLADMWKAKTLLLTQDPGEAVVRLLESALAALTEPADLADRHDVLLALARIFHGSEPLRAEQYLRDAAAIS